ncbi:MAG: succinylglutamate desuccinylase [Armatimonadetes bacterium]|nr:succinylglutamate desuccinylase [Armatimonadota bacterium]
MSKDMQIGTAVAPRGSKVRGVIPVGKRAGAGPIEIPLTVVNGAHDGPTLWLDGSLHGDEHEGPIALLHMINRLDPESLRGCVVCVPVVNVPAWEFSTRGNPGDLFTYDLNRIYPGRPDGHLTERIADAHYQEMIEHADMEISVHSGGAHSYLAYAQFFSGTPEGYELAKAMGPKWDLLLKHAGERGSPQAMMRAKGRPAITVELGGLCDTFPDRFRATGEHLYGAFLNVMRHYKMIDGKTEYAPKWMVGVQKTVILAPTSGFWVSEPSVLRQRIKEGTKIATIYNLYGDVEAEIKAPFDGVPFGIRTNPAVQLGDWCVFYGLIEEEIS